ncbi:Zn(2)-C6 fungal-type DNA-binding domain protein [Apiospora marii]|uniref:Zn(2)-C6 fungal-type DNA-binding domain protein n=1 Tax=Apiospora marii TaxID=335849 RepID=A0ABR1RTB4_9PEZI
MIRLDPYDDTARELQKPSDCLLESDVNGHSQTMSLVLHPRAFSMRRMVYTNHFSQYLGDRSRETLVLRAATIEPYALEGAAAAHSWPQRNIICEIYDLPAPSLDPASSSSYMRIQIVDLALANLETDATNHMADSRFESSHSFDMAMVQPLFFTASKCREPLLRRRAVAGLEKIDGPGLYDGRMMAQVARWAIAMEEKDPPDTPRVDFPNG